MEAKTQMCYPLRVANEHDCVMVKELKGNHQFKNNCINQGIVPGQKLEILNNSGHGPCLVANNCSRVMIGEGMLNRIMVSKI